jgi:predicted transposase
MKQTMLLKLAPTEEQHQALLETMHAFNAACDYVAEIAFSEKTANKFALQKIVYGELRTTYKLASQLAIRAISKASEAYKRDKGIKPTFRREGALSKKSHRKRLFKPPAHRSSIAHQSLDNVTPQAIDFLHLAELLRAEANDFSGLETAVEEQVGYPLFALVRELTAHSFPYLTTLVRIFH